MIADSVPQIVTTAATGGLIALSVAVLLCFIRLVRGPTLADRAMALDLIAVLLVGLLVLYGIRDRTPEPLSIGTVLALTNFVGTIGFAVYIRKKSGK